MDVQSLESSSYLRRPLYVYDLPPELLDSLTVRTIGNTTPQITTHPEASLTEKSREPNEDGTSASATCALCQAAFRDVNEQRQHVRSDFHRYNLKLSVKNLPAVNEETFVKQIGDLDESISGSDTSDSEQDGDDTRPNDSTLTALLKRQAKISAPEDDSFVVSRRKVGAGNAPVLWMSSSKVGHDTGFGVYRAILSEPEQQEAPLHLIDILKQRQIKPVYSKQSGQKETGRSAATTSPDPHFFLCMIGGGHFAASIVSLVPEIRRGPGGVEERHAIVKAHKTFHRYTTRRKQGGAQSANDNAKGNAHSAGSSIRRYNEAALELDVRNILSEWKAMIDSAQLLFIRATGTTNRRTLFGPYDGQVLYSNDKRLRGFPFSTRRATQAELLRSFQQLTRLQVSTFTEVAEETPKPKPTPKAPSQKPVAPARSKEEEAALLHTSQLQNLIRRTKAPGLLLYLTKNELSPDFEFYPAVDHHHAPTPLHLAASTSSPALVTALLTKARANPTLKNNDGKTPYQVAGDPKTRDAFRTARHLLGEDKWDWSAAHVPAALSPEEFEAKSRREQEIADAAEAERRRADLERIRQDEERRKVGKIEKKAGAGTTLGVATEKSGSEKREEDIRGLTPEMKQRLERERRARAAEARIKAMNGGK